MNRAATAQPATFVNRTRELDEIRAALTAGWGGRGSLLLVTGPAGIGKTSLVRAALADEEDMPGLVAWSAAWDAGGAPPYWIWVQLLRKLAERLGADRLKAAVPSDGVTVRRLVPDILDDAAPGPAPPGEDERFALFDALTRTLRHLSADTPLVLVLEDLHAADADAILLLDFLARAISDAAIVVVGTLREDPLDPVDSERVVPWERARSAAHVIALEGLGEDEVSQLLADEGQGARSRAFARRIHSVTDGNPLFVAECLRLLDSADRTVTSAIAIPALPEGVRDAVRRRLDGTPAEIRDVLDAAAVIGREFRLDMLVAVLGSELPVVVAALDQATAQNVVRAVPQTPGTYVFGHSVVREVLHAELPAGRRVELHRGVAEVLEAGDIEENLAAAAYHWFEAAGAGDASKALEYGRRAGDQAMSILGFEGAEEHYANALRALELQGRDDTLRCDLLWALGDAQTRAGHLASARRALEEAFGLARRLDDPERAARVALAASPWGLSVTVADEPLIAMLGEALAQELTDPVLKARLLAASAVAQYWSVGSDERLGLVDEAIGLARASGDARALARVLADAHIATWDPDSPDRSLPWAAEIETIETKSRDTELTLYAQSWQISLLLELGEVADADQAIAAFERRARESGQPRAMRYALRHRALRAALEGRSDEVEQLLAEATTAADLREGSTESMLLAGLAFVLRWSQGKLGDLEPAVRTFADSVPAMPAWRCALAAVYAQQGRTAEMRREYDRLAASRFTVLTRDNLWLVGLTLLTDVCEALEDAEGAAALTELLLPYAGRNAVTADAAVFGPVDRCLGRLALVRGEHDEALDRLTKARRQADSMGARSIVAHLLADEARARRARAAEGDADTAVRLMKTAAAEAATLGLAGLSEQAETFLQDVPDAPQAAAGGAIAAGPREAVLERRGDMWNVVFGDVTFLARDSKGIAHLARLLASPDVEFHALDLVAGPAAVDPGAGLAAGAAGLHSDAESGSGPVLDAQAKAAFKDRLDELAAEIEQAESFNDPERADRAREERDMVAHELSSAVGLHGRDRQSGSVAERARVNVTRAIRTAVERLGEHDAVLRRHLEVGIRTGTFCVYRPEPGMVAWTVKP